MHLINTISNRVVQAVLCAAMVLAIVGSAQAQSAPKSPAGPAFPVLPVVPGVPHSPYRFIKIDKPDVPGTSLSGISDAGIVGAFGGLRPGDSTPLQGLLEMGGKFATINRPETTETAALGINNAGVIVGASSGVAWLRSASGQFQNAFDFADHGVTILDSGASGINNLGDIVGSFLAKNLGDFVGPTGFGFLTPHGTLGIANPVVIFVPSSINTSAQGINDAEQIVGFYDTNQGTRGFLRAPNGTITTIYIPNSGDTDAFGINNSGIIVGGYNAVPGEPPGDHGFVWNSTNGSFITLDVPGATSTDANGIDDDNNIVGQYIDVEGNVHGFLAAPLFAGMPGRSNCATVTLNELEKTHHGSLGAADALEFTDVGTLEIAIIDYCGTNIASR